MAEQKTPSLPMTLAHQVAILVHGTKTSTLRSQKLADGRYRLTTARGSSAGEVELRYAGRQIVHWPTMKARDPKGARELAKCEGYADVPAFEAAVRRIPGGASFLQGNRSYYLHWIKPVQSAESSVQSPGSEVGAAR